MKPHHRPITSLILLGVALTIASAVIHIPLSAARAADPPTSQPAQPLPPRHLKAQLRREANFQRMLTGATLKGTWQVADEKGLRGLAPLSEPRPDEYTIDKVSKAGDDYWIITARIKYADKDVHIPVTVRVIWAEFTPIIVVDDAALPGLGTYSARVMFNRSFYSGTWFGRTYGGVLSGQILHEPTTTAPATSSPRHEAPTSSPAEK